MKEVLVRFRCGPTSVPRMARSGIQTPHPPLLYRSAIRPVSVTNVGHCPSGTVIVRSQDSLKRRQTVGCWGGATLCCCAGWWCGSRSSGQSKRPLLHLVERRRRVSDCGRHGQPANHHCSVASSTILSLEHLSLPAPSHSARIPDRKMGARTPILLTPSRQRRRQIQWAAEPAVPGHVRNYTSASIQTRWGQLDLPSRGGRVGPDGLEGKWIPWLSRIDSGSDSQSQQKWSELMGREFPCSNREDVR